MKCPKCGKEAKKMGTRPVIKRGVVGKRVQAYLCTNPTCWHQWRQSNG